MRALTLFPIVMIRNDPYYLYGHMHIPLDSMGLGCPLRFGPV
jgi:hypothetical protein